MLKHFSKFLPLRTLDLMYKTLARSHFDYCDLIYHIPPSSTETGLTLHRVMEKVERTQYLAALSVTGAWQGSSRSKIYEELGWETLSDRRLCRRILQVHKIIDNKAPGYLKEKLPPNRNNFLPYVFQNVRCRTECFKSSFYPNATYLWNEIISDFENLPTFDSLKSHILSFFRPTPKSVFNVHDPVFLRNIFQLRLGLSCLNAHKRHHNFVETPSAECLCQEGEKTTHHFLFSCQFFTEFRPRLINSLSEVLQKHGLIHLANETDTYLYGHFSIDVSDNRIILQSSIRYLKDTKRLSTS